MENLDILCCGELTIDEISTTEKITDDHKSAILKSTGQYYGGRGGNFSVYSSLFDVRVGLVSAISHDPESLEYKKHLASKNIDISNLFENAKAHTSKCFIFSEGEKNRIFFYGGALQEERKNYLNHVKNAVNRIGHNIIYCTSPDQEINTTALINSKAETKIYGPSNSLYTHSKESIVECLSNTDMLFLNQHESEFIEEQLKMRPKDIAKEFGIKLLIKTLGGAGSQLISEQETIHIPPFKSEKVLDTTGAGDAFAGAFIANYLKTKDLVYSGKVASAVASFVIEEMGCQTNIPTLEKIMQRIQSPVI